MTTYELINIEVKSQRHILYLEIYWSRLLVLTSRSGFDGLTKCNLFSRGHWSTWRTNLLVASSWSLYFFAAHDARRQFSEWIVYRFLLTLGYSLLETVFLLRTHQDGKYENW